MTEYSQEWIDSLRQYVNKTNNFVETIKVDELRFLIAQIDRLNAENAQLRAELGTLSRTELQNIIARMIVFGQVDGNEVMSLVHSMTETRGLTYPAQTTAKSKVQPPITSKPQNLPG